MSVRFGIKRLHSAVQRAWIEGAEAGTRRPSTGRTPRGSPHAPGRRGERIEWARKTVVGKYLAVWALCAFVARQNAVSRRHKASGTYPRMQHRHSRDSRTERDVAPAPIGERLYRNQRGILLAVALTIEVLFLGVILADRLADGGRGRSVLLTALVILALPAGSLLALPLAAMPQPITTALLAMGLIALLYLVTEELLAEAHEVAENSWVTATFFIGFLLLLILDEQIK